MDVWKQYIAWWQILIRTLREESPAMSTRELVSVFVLLVAPMFGVLWTLFALGWIYVGDDYKEYVEFLSLFRGCSAEFKHKIAGRLHVDIFYAGQMIMNRRNRVDQLYFVHNGVLEEIWVGEDGSEAKVSVLSYGASVGATSVLYNIPQHCNIRARVYSELLRIDRQSFSRILEIYCADACKVLNNLIKDGSIANNAAYCGDLELLKSLIRAGVDPRKNYSNGRSALHEAALRGQDKIVRFLIEKGVDINAKDRLGNTPLFDALNGGHDRVASLLHSKGALLEIGDPDNFMCNTILGGDSYLLKRLLSYGIDPNSKDSMGRTPLHVAASKGLYVMSKVLIEAGADVLAKDRIGCTPLDEGRNCTNVNTIRLLEEAANVTHISCNSQETKDKAHRKRCSVFAHHPLQEGSSTGVVVSVPDTVQTLMEVAAEHLGVELGDGWSILSQDGCKYLDVDLISDNEKLYLVRE